MSSLAELDQQFFLWLNGHHAAWVDSVMLLITGRLVWIPFYMALIGWLVYKQQKQAVWSVLAIIVAVALSDQATSGLMKPFFERLRPCHEPSVASLTHLVGGCGGKFGFASSHAANTFALAALVGMLHPGKRAFIAAMYTWAALVSYSRIYVGVHYPGDILAGALVGMAIACVVYALGQKTGRLKHI